MGRGCGFKPMRLTATALASVLLVIAPVRGRAADNAHTRVDWASADTFYVSPAGDDDGPGTKAHPFRTIQKARDTIAERSQPMKKDIYVYLRGGTYFLSAPLIFTPADSGTNGHIIHYLAYANERSIVSGGKTVTGWTRYKGNIYAAHLDREMKLRQLYVNGQRAFMARGKAFSYSPAIKGYGSFKITGTEPWAMTPGTRFAGFTFPKQYLRRYNNPEDVEITSKAGFGYHIISLSNILDLGSNSVAILQEPIGAIAQSIPQYGCAFISDKPELDAVSQFYFQNALELLNTPGQFYFDRHTKTLYYYKRPNEDMSTAEVIAPLTDRLMLLHGQSTHRRVENLEFRGITFAYAHYSLQKVGDSHGDTAVQSIALYTKYIDDGVNHSVKYVDNTLQGAAIESTNSDHISFIGDVFEHLGGVGLSLGNDADHARVIGSVFYDIGSAAINVGDPRNVYIGDGDFPPGVEGVPTGDIIENNSLRDLSVESLQAPAVSIFYTRNLNFSHNEISTAPYTGISLGWGWTAFTRITKPHHYSRSSANNTIAYNRITDVLLKMHDGAGIYTLGEQPGSVIKGNFIGMVGGFSKGAAIYLDQGSRFLTITDNYSTNPNGWFFVWGKAAQVYNITAADNYSSVVHGNEGQFLNDSPHFVNASSTPTASNRLIPSRAGLEPQYFDLRSKE